MPDMQTLFSRRTLMQTATIALVEGKHLKASPLEAGNVPETFPTQPPALVREMVSVSHASFKRVRELVETRPALAKAAWDWGFGDWETALGAASHMGNREIAEYLLANGAPPTLYSATMLGQLDVVKAILAAQPGAQRVPGPHSIPLLAHAKNGGPRAAEVYRYLESLGDAGMPPVAPLTQEEAASLVGTYVFGIGPADRIEITTARLQMTFMRVGTTGRGLVHLGDHVFHPAGSSAVRIRFSNADGVMTLTIHDPDLVLTAKRQA
jgi:hypothetical protein